MDSEEVLFLCAEDKEGGMASASASYSIGRSFSAIAFIYFKKSEKTKADALTLAGLIINIII